MSEHLMARRRMAVAEIPAHWYGLGHAPRFSRSVALASQAVGAAEAALRAALEAAYPHGAAVYVIHSRGCFTGTVHGWDTYGCRVLVLNDRTKKAAKWWAAHVQLQEHTSDGADGVDASVSPSAGEPSR